MTTRNAGQDGAARRVLPIAGAAALAMALTASLPQPAQAGQITPPPVPFNLRVEEGNVPFLLGHAIGTQNYICLPSGSGFAWTLFTPEATLFSEHFKQLTTHFFGPNPEEDNTIRAAWQHSKDSSTVWARVALGGTATSTDPHFVAEGAVPWLLLEKRGVAEGPSGGDTLTVTTFVQRLNTAGGVAPESGCSQLSDVGKKAFVPYRADYFFYRASDPDEKGH